MAELANLPKGKTYTIRDVILVVALLVNPIVWFAKIDAHVSDRSVHPDREKQVSLIREEIDLAIAKDFREFRAQVFQDLRDIKTKQDELANSVARLEAKGGK